MRSGIQIKEMKSVKERTWILLLYDIEKGVNWSQAVKRVWEWRSQIWKRHNDPVLNGCYNFVLVFSHIETVTRV